MSGNVNPAATIAMLGTSGGPSCQATHTGANQHIGQHGAERAAAAERDLAGKQALLSFLAYARKAHLAAVAFEGSVRCHLGPC